MLAVSELHYINGSGKSQLGSRHLRRQVQKEADGPPLWQDSHANDQLKPHPTLTLHVSLSQGMFDITNMIDVSALK